MNTWNYRVVESRKKGFALVEVYYNSNNINGYIEPKEWFETLEDLEGDTKAKMKAFLKDTLTEKELKMTGQNDE